MLFRSRVPAEAIAPRPVFDRAAHIGIHPQKQKGLHWIGVVLPVGKLTAAQMCGIAAIAQQMGDGDIRLTVWQNLWVAQNSPEDRARRGFFARWLGGRRGVREEITRLLEFGGLAHKRDELAANLSFGEQRRLEIARALATEPMLLALDEPAAGMNTTETETLRRLLERLRSDGTTLLLIEHDVKLVMG